MKYLGIDYGEKRVGIALSDEEGKMAFAYDVFENNEKLVARIFEVVEKENIKGIIMGESKNYAGEPNEIMGQIEKFKKELEEKTKLPVILEPEFLTSAQAERIQGKNEMHDASAAAIILQSYLDKNRHMI